MASIALDGRTVLFVSHNMTAIKQFCQSAIVLRDGRLDFQGPAVNGVARYALSFAAADASQSVQRGTRWRQAAVNGRDVTDIVGIVSGEPLSVSALLECADDFVRGEFVCRVANASQDTLIRQNAEHDQLGVGRFGVGQYRLRVDVPPLWLAPGPYTITLTFFGEINSRRRAFESAPITVNVTGSLHGNASLAPPLRWNLAPVLRGLPDSLPETGAHAVHGQESLA
jgi:lipopolysaccharide transport system ATP-binding protein